MDLAIFKNPYSAVGYCSLVLVEMITLVSSCTTPILITRLHTDLSQLAISQFPVAFFTNNLSWLLHTSHPSSLSINCWAQSAKSPERFHAMLLEFIHWIEALKNRKVKFVHTNYVHIYLQVYLLRRLRERVDVDSWWCLIVVIGTCHKLHLH